MGYAAVAAIQPTEPKHALVGCSFEKEKGSIREQRFKKMMIFNRGAYRVQLRVPWLRGEDT